MRAEGEEGRSEIAGPRIGRRGDRGAVGNQPAHGVQAVGDQAHAGRGPSGAAAGEGGAR